MALHGVGVALRVVVLAVGERRLRDERAQPGVVGRLGEVRQLLVGHGQILPELAQAAGHLREAPFDDGLGHRGESRSGAAIGPTVLRDDAQVPLPPTRSTRACALGVAVTVWALAGCGAGSSDEGCGPITREALDGSYLVHVLGTDSGVTYTSDPPTSGPHQPGPEVSGVLDEPITRPIQVGILERGDILLQHDPDLPADQRADLEGLAGPGVVVAPNPDLPDPVVATAWTYKQTCATVDVDALAEFVAERSGKGPEG